MSDYKVVQTNIEMVDKECLIQALETMFGTIEENVMTNQKWSWHNRQVDICIRQNQLPQELQGFGDVGLVMKNGRYEFLGISERDSHYIDEIKRDKMIQNGLSRAEAAAIQPDGKFEKDMTEYFHTLENGYELFKFQQQIMELCPSAQFGQVQGEESDSRAWMMTASVSESDLKALGITIPA